MMVYWAAAWRPDGCKRNYDSPGTANEVSEKNLKLFVFLQSIGEAVCRVRALGRLEAGMAGAPPP